jgi:L-ascorbate metabolism protein UlaG (beta-lactamase superfamily)
MTTLLRRAFLGLLAIALGAAPALACGVAARHGPLLHRASTAADTVTITFLGHATFAIETPGGTLAATDYSGRHRPYRVPDLVTMNHAHSTHYTDNPDPRIAHVLRGWRNDGGPAMHDLRVGDLRVRNLPTNIRTWEGGTRRYGNSVFVFEAAGLCIAHLGHLHHLLTADDLGILGPIDIVMAPIDGSWTSSQGDIVEVITQLHPRIVLPMHYWSADVLRRFLARMEAMAEIRIQDSPRLTVSRATMPPSPLVVVLPGPHF